MVTDFAPRHPACVMPRKGLTVLLIPLTGALEIELEMRHSTRRPTTGGSGHGALSCAVNVGLSRKTLSGFSRVMSRGSYKVGVYDPGLAI
jgi:hypothetical protein